MTQCLHVNKLSSKTSGNDDVSTFQSLCVTLMTITINGDLCNSRTVVVVSKIVILMMLMLSSLLFSNVSVIVVKIIMITREQEQTYNANHLCHHELGSS